jgi:hypothetical protein
MATKAYLLSDEQVASLVTSLLTERIDWMKLSAFPQATSRLIEIDELLRLLGYSVRFTSRHSIPTIEKR